MVHIPAIDQVIVAHFFHLRLWLHHIHYRWKFLYFFSTFNHRSKLIDFCIFWHKFLYDIGAVPTAEPYAKRTAQGLILGPDGEKMSKSKGNVVDPNEVVDEFGADVLRAYVLFMGDYEKAAPWSETAVKGCKRFIDRVWGMLDIVTDGDSYSKELESAFHKTIKKVTSDIENLKYNTAIAAMMTLTNEIYAKGSVNKAELKSFITILNPFAPHITEEMWEQLGFEGMLNQTSWPSYDEAKCVDNEIEIAVQINGKVREKLVIAAEATQEEAISAAKALDKIADAINGMTIVKELYVKGRLVNIVVRP